MLFCKIDFPYSLTRHDGKTRSYKCSLTYWQEVGSQNIATKTYLSMASVKPEIDTDGKCGENFDREKTVRQELPDLKPVEIWTNTLRATVT